MTKDKSNKTNIFQLLFLPVLFAQYLFSFALAAGLRLLFKKEHTDRRALTAGETREEDVDPVVMRVIEEVGNERPANSMQVS